ncbi:regulator [Streptomyces sp.]|uniref:regulator n=1 Tax=Streptomyces sp. TaxID=1931 RepID=UPI002F42CB22
MTDRSTQRNPDRTPDTILRPAPTRTPARTPGPAPVPSPVPLSVPTAVPTPVTAGHRAPPSAPPTRTTRHNTRLAALIAEAGFSNAGLARRVDQLGLEHGLDLRYDKTSVTRWLRGQQPRGATPALIAEVFTQRLGRRLSPPDLGLDSCAPVYAGLEYAASPEEAVDIVSGLWRKDTGNPAELRKITSTPAGLVVPSRDWLIGRADDSVARVGGAGGGATGGGGAPAPAGVGDLAARVPGQSRGHTSPGRAGPGTAGGKSSSLPGFHAGAARGRISAGDVAAVRAVGDLFRTLDHAYGGGHARQALVRYLEYEAEPMLRGRYGENTGRGLFASVAELTRLAGWTSYDIGAHGIAQRYFVQALRLAQAAGDRVYGGYVLVTMSRQAVYLGHGREAVQLARVAQQGVGTGAPAVAQALLHAAEARGHGLLGDVRACTAALVRAERALSVARGGDEVPPWARFFDEAQLADEFGHCHRDLHQHRLAARYAERSLQLRPVGYARSRLFCRTVLACARLGLGEVDTAGALGLEVVQQAADLRSARAAEYVRDLVRRFEPYRNVGVVRAFHERVGALGR